jgi:methyl-accepting chemotaxis protein
MFAAWPSWLPGAHWPRPATLFTGYHGIWSPGIQLLRNLRMAHKTTLVLLVLLLPVGMLVGDAAALWRQRHEMTRQAVVGQERYRRLVEFNISVGDLGTALYLRARGLPHGDLTALRAQEAQAFQALQDGLASPSAPADSLLQGALRKLQAGRDLLLSRLDDERPAEVPGGLGPRWQAYFAQLDQIETLRGLIVDRGAAALDVDPDSSMLRTGLLDAQFQAQGALARLTARAVRLYRLEGHASRLHDVLTQAARTGLLLGQSSQQAEHALARRLIEPDRARQDLLQQQQFLARVDRLVRAVPEATSAADLTTTTGIDADQLLAAGMAAVRGSGRLQRDAIAAIGERVRQREIAEERQLIERGVELTVLLLAGSYLMVCMYRVLAGGMAALCSQLDELGRGNLSIRPRGWGHDEIGHALTTLGESAERMAGLFEAVTQGVSAVLHASREVATGNAGLSARTGHVKQSIDDVNRRSLAFAAAMDSCARQVDQAAEHVHAMRAEARRSRRAMAGLRERMQLLQRRSREISHVVGLVQSVAFQTKLLSLNASVEAARAGSVSRGFSVVAQEVRALAQRSEDAASKIAAIVSGSVAEIEEGNAMTERAGQAVSRTDEGIHAVDRIMDDIVRLTRDSMA